jgi:peptidyl-prolyl cis-trans isomerase C
MRLRTLAWALALATLSAVCAACSACKQPPSPAGDGGAAASQVAELTPAQAAQVLAHVGNRTITLGDFAATIEHMDSFDRMRYQAPERRKELLGEMIDVMLLADEARAQHQDQNPATQQEVRQILRDALLKKAQQDVPKPAEIPADEVAAYFEAHKADFEDPERRRVSAIIVASPTVAAGLVAALKGPGALHWGEFVRSKSLDPQAKANVPVDLAGDLGFVSPPGDPRGGNGRIPDEVRAAVFTLAKVGDIAPDPVAAGGKLYVVKLVAKTDPHDRTLQDAERTIRVRLAQDKIRAKQDSQLDELKARYPVKIDDAALATVKVDLPSVDGGTGPR